MDPFRLIVRIVFTYIVVLAFTRVSGKRAVQHGNLPSFVVAVVIGDMFDDVVWSEVPVSQFAVAVATLFLIHLHVTLQIFHSGGRKWRRVLG